MPSRALPRRWAQKREAHWQRFESLIESCGRRGVSALSRQELRELALLYRQTASDLAEARASSWDEVRARRLNRLLGRAHTLLYAAAPRERRSVVGFYRWQFPRVFRETWPYTAAAAAIMVCGAIGGALLVWGAPGFERFFLGGQMLDTIERREMWTHSILALKPVASSGIMTNNLSVAFAACASGVLAGLGTTYILTFNGIMLGVIAAACHRVGMDASLWSFVAPHGVFELPAIVIAGGAGLILAQGVLAPGEQTRRDALVAAGRTAVQLLLGVIPMLIVAGIIEGFVSPTALAPWIKFAIGGALSVLLALYLANGMGEPSHNRPSRFTAR